MSGVEQFPETVVLVHPDDLNLADAKALAALHGASVVGNRYVPRGQMFLADANAPSLTPAECGARIATAHPRASQVCVLPVLHEGDHSPVYPPGQERRP